MTANDESLQGTFTSDGTVENVESVTVPADEVWFIDSVHIISDGTGSTGTMSVQFNVGDSTVLTTILGEAVTGGRCEVLNADSDSADSLGRGINAYAGSGETIRVDKRGDPNTGATFSYTVTIRRIV